MGSASPCDDTNGNGGFFNLSTSKGKRNVTLLALAGLLGAFGIYQMTVCKPPPCIPSDPNKKQSIEMAGDAHVDESKLTGLSKIFNGTTTRGRAHVAMATYASIGLLIAFFTLKPKKPKQPKA